MKWLEKMTSNILRSKNCVTLYFRKDSCCLVWALLTGMVLMSARDIYKITSILKWKDIDIRGP